MGKRRRLSLKDFKTEAKDGDPGECLIAKGYGCDVEKATGDLEGERRLQFTISTGSVDRVGDTVSPGGAANLKSFPKNGVVLWAHDASLPPIAKPIKAWRDGDAIKSVAEFTPADLDHPLGRGFGSTIYRYFVEKFMKSVSIGFIPSKWKWSEEEGREYGIDFLKWELLEFSPVPIPANREAVVEMAHKGIDMRGVYDWAAKCLDGGVELIVPRELVEDAHKGLGEIYGKSPTISIPAPTDKDPAAETKAGRVLSKKNENDLVKARDLVTAVLDQVAAEAEEDDDDDKAIDKPRADMDKLHDMVATLAEAVKALTPATPPAPPPPAPSPMMAVDPTDEEITRALREIIRESSDEVLRQYTGEVR